MGVILREKKLKGGKKSLYLEYNFNGTRKYEVLNIHLTSDKEANKEKIRVAKAIRAQREQDIILGQFNLPDYKKQKLDFVKYYKQQVDKRPPDRPAWQNSYTKLETFTGGTITFAEITNEWIEKYQLFLITEVSQNTAYHYYANFKYVINQAIREKIITENPCLLVKNLKKADVKREYLDIEEIELLRDTECTSPEVKMAFLFACFTGLRLSDIYNLKWGNIKGDTIEYKQKKTGRNEYLNLTETAKAILEKKRLGFNIIPLSTINVFNLPTKSPLSSIIRKWIKKSKLNKRITFHCARHTFATLALTNKVDLYTVSKLLGHKDITTTQIYAKIIDAKKKEAVNLIPKLMV